jgi:4a-hydroxytetrahydrobiopterin dehydratase
MVGNNWIEKEGRLTKDFEFVDFVSALDFVNRVGELAEKVGHHPDITFGWGYAHISIYTHDQTKLTSKDYELSEKIDLITI